MQREDYISQMIEQMGTFIRRIFNQSAASQETIENELEGQAGEWTGLPASMLLSLPADEVYQLFLDSDRMIVEKSYFVAELYRAKGLGAKDAESKAAFFNKALFFYNKSTGSVGTELQGRVDEHIAELTEVLSKQPGAWSPIVENTSATMPPPDSVRMTKRTRKKAGTFWLVLVLCLVVAALVSIFTQSSDSIGIEDSEWSFQANVAVGHFRLVNNTAEDQLVKIRLSAEHYSSDAFSSGYTFLGSAEREYQVAAGSSKYIEESFKDLTNASGPNRSVAIEIISIQAATP